MDGFTANRVEKMFERGVEISNIAERLDLEEDVIVQHLNRTTDPKPDKVKRLEDVYGDLKGRLGGVKVSALAKALGVSASTVYHWVGDPAVAEYMGYVPVNPKQRDGAYYDRIVARHGKDKVELFKKGLEDGLPATQAADCAGLAHGTVYRWLKHPETKDIFGYDVDSSRMPKQFQKTTKAATQKGILGDPPEDPPVLATRVPPREVPSVPEPSPVLVATVTTMLAEGAEWSDVVEETGISRAKLSEMANGDYAELWGRARERGRASTVRQMTVDEAVQVTALFAYGGRVEDVAAAVGESTDVVQAWYKDYRDVRDGLWNASREYDELREKMDKIKEILGC